MIVFDLLVLWAWEYDADFIDLLDKACMAHGVSAQLCGPNDMARIRSFQFSTMALGVRMPSVSPATKLLPSAVQP